MISLYIVQNQQDIFKKIAEKMMDKKTSLLEKYTKYNQVNISTEGKSVKILVSYIKPSFLFKSEILTPIHLGKAVETASSKDGALSQSDIEWLHRNCEFNDDFEGGISQYNRRVGFLTGTYWAWKNYEKLGNPDYFGSFGYRRLFDADCLVDIDKYDAIIPTAVDTKESIIEHFEKFHGKKSVDAMKKAVENIHFEDMALFNEYFSLKEAYLYEMYILKKKLFFDFCEWIFPMLFYLLDLPMDNFILLPDEKQKMLKAYEDFCITDCNKNNYEQFYKRNIGFIIERLTGLYLYKLKTSNKYQIKECSCIFTESEKYHKERNKQIFALLRNKMR